MYLKKDVQGQFGWGLGQPDLVASLPMGGAGLKIGDF